MVEDRVQEKVKLRSVQLSFDEAGCLTPWDFAGCSQWDLSSSAAVVGAFFKSDFLCRPQPSVIEI